MERTAITDEELLYTMALTQAEGIGDKLARQLLLTFGSAKEVFQASRKALNGVDGFGDKKINALKSGLDRERLEHELAFIRRNEIKALPIYDPAYPERLKLCADAPILLYVKGKVELNPQRVVAIVGTRRSTEYGVRLTEELVEGLRNSNVMVVSGLATGIDSIAHRKSIQCQLPTVGVLAHGLDRIYPAEHRNMAREMIQHGGLLTEHPSGTIPDRFHFPMRNRIVAGMSDVTVLVETEVRGGAMITAKLAASYNREVASFPGRTIDLKSSGCNYLIRTHMAHLITGYQDLLSLMNWDDPAAEQVVQTRLFDHLSDEEHALLHLLENSTGMHIDELSMKSGFGATRLAALLLQLELASVVKALPGKRYCII